MKIRIIAQYRENYAAGNENWDGKQTAWKDKGGSEFVVDLNKDKTLAFLRWEELTEIAENVLASKSNLHVQYQLIDMERIMEDPEDVTADFVKESKKLGRVKDYIQQFKN
jgi:hypothetical protein